MVRGRLVLPLVTALLVCGAARAENAVARQRVEAAASSLMAQRGTLGLDGRHGFQMRTFHEDELGQTHARHQQLYKGLKVWGAELITHTDARGRALPHTLDLRRNIEVEVDPSLNADEAIALAHADLAPRGAYALAPQAELLVLPRLSEVPRDARRAKDATLDATQYSRQVDQYRLAYHVATALENGAEETSHMNYLIDAHTGAILEKWDDLHTAAAVGSGLSQFSGTVAINTNSVTSGFELRDMTRGTGGTFTNNTVRNLNHATSGTGTIFADADNTWGDGANYVAGGSTTAANGETAAVDAAWGLQWTWDYYKNVFGRNGIDGNGKSTYLLVHYSNKYDNAYWSDTCFCMTFGDGSSFKSLEAMDVMGHEMSHGVCAKTAALTYSGESGGLNEANSDIHGTMVEFYSRSGGGATIGSTGGNWTIGEQLETASFPTPLRYMYKPSKDGSSPDAWSSTLKNLDVHYSSGPMNRCFYFLSQGSSATSGDYYTSYLPKGMTGVGNDHAARIWYRAMVTYMTASTNYAAARTASISAAKDLYGAGSAEEQAVWNAFAGINVGAAWTSTTTAPAITTQPAAQSVTVGATATFSVVASGTGLTYQWMKGGANVSGATAASYTTPATVLADSGSVYSVKVSNTYGSVTSANATLTVSSAPTTKELILNGGFESGATSWTATTGTIGTFTKEPAYAGTKNLVMGGTGKTLNQTAYQTVTIPSTATTATLSFFLHIDTAETSTTAYDTLTAVVQNSSGTALKTLATYSNANKATGYALKSFDVSAYKGQTIRVYFKGAEDSSLQTSFAVDNVSLTYK